MRWTWWHFAAVAALGIALTGGSLYLGWPFGGFFLLLPLVFPPWRFGTTSSLAKPRRCPRCDFTSAQEGFAYCPRDGSRLLGDP